MAWLRPRTSGYPYRLGRTVISCDRYVSLGTRVMEALVLMCFSINRMRLVLRMAWEGGHTTHTLIRRGLRGC